MALIKLSEQTALRKQPSSELKDFEAALKEHLADVEPESTTGSATLTVDEPLATQIRAKYDEVKAQRSELEQQWLEDIRQYRGVYSPEVLEKMHPNRSKAFIRITRTKVKTVDSRLIDFLFPANGDKNWSIDKTPIAEYSQQQVAELAQMLTQQTGQEITTPQLQQVVESTADERAGKMSQVVEDQLTELRYRDILKEVVHSGNLYGTGVLKGPMVNIKRKKTYSPNLDQQNWEMQQVDALTPFIESVPIWDIFPDLSATNIEDCNFVVQRHKMPKHKLMELSTRKDFNGKAIKRYLDEQKSGDFEDQYYDTELQTMGGLSTATSAIKENKKFEVLEFWGYLDADDLQSVDIDIPEKKQSGTQVAACVWVLGNRIIKACLTPIEGVKWPYYFYYYDKDETSIFGEGIAAILRDIQELLNASFRGMLDNAAIAGGPQLEVNLDLLDPDEDPTEVYPFKVWLRSGAGADASSPALRIYDIPSRTMEFIKMSETFEKYGDEVTTIPRYMWGDNPGGGAGRTASGLSMMLGSANITIKDQVKNFDDGITTPFIEGMYHWNMQFNEDDAIKGDFSVRAQGSSSLIAKEVYSNSLMQFASLTASEQYANLIKPANVLRSIVDVLDLDDKSLIKTDQELKIESEQSAKQQQEFQQFMTGITETARKFGVSPQDMLSQGQALLVQKKQGQEQNAQQQAG